MSRRPVQYRNLHYMRKILFFMLLSLGLFIGCSDDANFDPNEDKHQDQIENSSIEKANASVVPVEVAQNIAENYQRIKPERFNDGNNTSIKRKIDTHHVINDKEGIPALYVFTYHKNQGYVVISADWRHEPVCAVTGNGTFPDYKAPSMLINWFETTVENIEILRYEGFDNTERARNAWNKIHGQITTTSSRNWTYPECCEECPNWPDCFDENIDCETGGGPAEEYCDPVWDPNPCGSYTTTTVGPLLATTWGQGCGYNDQVPNLNCTDICSANASNTRAWTGCVATAMAQVIRFHGISTSHGYNYGSMPNGSGNSEVQRLMDDAGESVDMNYGCDGSGANGGKGPNALKNEFDFGSANRNSYGASSYLTVINNHNRGLPVLLEGCRTRRRFLGITWWYANCHEWVCDGYERIRNNCYSYLDLHMNWGWNSSHNGWYLFNNWTLSNGRNYQYYQDYVHEIAP